MIGLPRGLSVYAYAAATDMRKSFHTLSTLVELEMKREVLCGELLLFVSRDRKRGIVSAARSPSSGREDELPGDRHRHQEAVDPAPTARTRGPARACRAGSAQS